MRLLHYSSESFQFDSSREYVTADFKPSGLWLSVEGDQDWRTWCEDEDFGLDRLGHVVEVTLKPNANVLLIDTQEKFDVFNAQFGRSDNFGYNNIKWKKVNSLHDGLIIAPYQWERRLDLHFVWYYGWDCASGVIWNLSTIAQVIPLGVAGAAK